MLKDVANIIRGLSADGVEAAKSGHPGLPLGCAEIGAVLFGEVMKYNPQNPKWPDRDRFVLSAGHGSMLLYSCLHLAGYGLPLDELKRFRQLGSKTPGHPEYDDTPGVEATTGPLGQGFANAVGMALAERMLAEKYNTDDAEIIDHYTYSLLGDGCMMEGITSEAASLAGHLGLSKLIAIYDDNDISIEGSTQLAFTESVGDRFKAYDWHVVENVDGHSIEELTKAITTAKHEVRKPTLIIAKTNIGCGAPNKQGTHSVHGAPLGDDEIKNMKKSLNLPVEEKFYVSEEVRSFFVKRNKELNKEYEIWQEKFNNWSKKHPELKEEWDAAFNLQLPKDLRDEITELKMTPSAATRKSSGEVLTAIADRVSYLVGGSADLAPSTNTYLGKYSEIQKGQYNGRNFRFGVREHAMGAIVNGISLHQGLRPFCATFLVFSDYMRSAIRMSALMNQPVIYILTHDSIYVGEDGPTHQPIEHIESLRLIPNLKVIRPGDEEETKEAWLEAMENTNGPTALILTRQGLPHIPKEKGITDIDKGAYVVSTEADQLEVTLMASGSEVSLAVEIAHLLKNKGKGVRIVSVPNRDGFVAQGEDYINEVLGDAGLLRVAIEAGVGRGWYQLLGNKSYVVSIEGFGASGSSEELEKKFGFVAEEITEKILNRIEVL